MKESKAFPARLPAALLALGAVLAAWNWYVQPERAGSWTAAMLLLFCMMLALFIGSRRTDNEKMRGAARQIQTAIVFAGAVMALALSVKLGNALGVWGDTDVARRGTMVIYGLFFALTGNAMPKTLTPLAAMHCDPAKVQAFQRFAGWTWVLTGLAFATVWLLLPVDVARPASLVLLVSGMFAIVTQMVRLRGSRQKEV